MNLVTDMLHAVWELGVVRLQGSVWRTTIAPAIIQNNIVIARITKTDLCHAVSCSQKEVFRNSAAESVPVILENISTVLLGRGMAVMMMKNRESRRRTQPI